jgi:hypothetical protein
MKKDNKGVITSCKWRKITKVRSETVFLHYLCYLSSFTVSDHTFAIFLHLQLVMTPLLSFFIYSFWSHLCCLSSFTVSDHTFVIFLHLQLLITPLISFFIYSFWSHLCYLSSKDIKGVIRSCKWRKITKVWSEAVNEER